jgi:hypothetical protein
MRGAIPTLHNTPSWHGTSLSTETSLLLLTFLLLLHPVTSVTVKLCNTPPLDTILSHFHTAVPKEVTKKWFILVPSLEVREEEVKTKYICEF